MKITPILSATLALLPLLPLQAHATDIKQIERAAIKAKTAYRTVLKKEGWSPVIACKKNKHPEVAWCGSGNAGCVSFYRKGNTYIGVNTFEDGDGILRSIHFASKSEVKNDLEFKSCMVDW